MDNRPDNETTRVEAGPGEIRISVRGLVEFVLRSGDIDNRRQGSPENAMQEGSRIHRMIQKREGSGYRAEVPLKYTLRAPEYDLVVEGRADGVIEDEGGVTIDEIKGTYRDVKRMREAVPVHVAQAKCYAYIYSVQNELKSVKIRMTYCNIETENMRYFYEECEFEALREWFEGLLCEYRRWSDHTWEWQKLRRASIEQMRFPFAYREGQKELVAYVYQTICHRRKLFIEAPTGVGKTISTVYPAIQAMGRGMGEKLFYLTAKTITRTVADDAIELLRGQGLKFKSVILTAKEKICFMEETECDPEHCPYAKGHYDRINGAMYDLLTHEDRFSREVIEEYAVRHQVCPFEFCLDMSLFSDGVIADYNYVFDPHVYLRRFFGDGAQGDYLFLIDEAHNLLERAREMYSASLIKEDFLALRKEIRQTIVSEAEEKSRKNQVLGQMTLDVTNMSEKGGGLSRFVRLGYAEKISAGLDKCNKELLSLKRECESAVVVERIDPFVKALNRLYGSISDYLEEQEEVRVPAREAILEFYFEIAHFLDIYERLDENYVKYSMHREDGSFLLKLFCVNPRENLKECMEWGISCVLFSATFLPIQYYKELLGGDPEDYEVYAKSVFDKEKRALFIADDVTSKYSRRSDEEFVRIAAYIREIVKNRHGNYMVFFPSYRFMERVFDIYTGEFAGEEEECVCQQESMSESMREEFLNRFRGNENIDFESVIRMEVEEDERTLIGFCVLGGIFGEGIDLKKDSLIGALIVGTGIPQVGFERELLKEYFDEEEGSGFDYAYRYPGMNKVLQAAGRVIRTVEDVGIIALLDERFLQYSYRRLFPREWEDFEVVKLTTVAKRVERFWDSWL